MLIKEIFGLLSSIATVLGIIAIYFTILQFREEQKKEKNTLNFNKSEKSIEVLSIFANDIIPEIENFWDKYNEEINKPVFKTLEKEKVELLKSIIKKECGCIKIFNNLEHTCLYIEADLVNSKIVYDPLNTLLCNFVKENEGVFKDICKVAPYKNLTSVYNKWTDQQKLNEINDQKRKLTKQEEEITNRNKK
ncbi:hypothetical protein [Carnobacterium divergens]|uniref:hypothetical protein n=1 Tax=Carnobacterium divergens TaxID=2748 RepID=UPI0039B02A2E